MALPRTYKEISFVSGLNTKGDERAQPEQFLSIGLNVEFDDVGGLRVRFPFDAVRSNILGGGTITNARRLAMNGDELVLFTDTSLYSWSARDSAWVLRGTHLAVKVDEDTAFATSGDQIDPDRAELNGAVMYAWSDSTKVYVAAKDKTTGAVLLSPTSANGASAASRPKLVALTTRIILFFEDGGTNLQAIAFNPASLSVPAPTSIDAVVHASYDVVKIPGADSCLIAATLNPNTSYKLIKVTSALAVTSSTKARKCDGPIAVSVTPDGAKAQVVRANGTNVQGDLITVSTLADIFTAQAIGALAGSPINQIAAAFRSVQNGGQYRCYAFWSSGEDPTNAGGFDTQTNWADTGNTLGTQSKFVSWVGVASRAFDYNGSIYVWLTFGQTSGLGSGAANTNSTGNPQNGYYLHRDDGFLCAKAVWQLGGGLRPTNGHLPTVALTDGTTGFTWCGTMRRLIAVGPGVDNTATWTAVLPGAVNPRVSTYAARSPREIAFAFDSNEARRCVREGNTLYIACGEGLLQYDGAGLYEVGFHVYPWYFDAVVSATGNIPDGLYGYKSTLRFRNAQNETERSTTATVANATMTGGPSGLATVGVNVPLTHKTTNVAALEVWRTELAPVATSPFFLVTSRDPSVTSNPNRYLPNAPTTGGFSSTMRDALTDAALAIGEPNPENGDVLENLPPPAASVIANSESRIFLAGVPGDPDRVWYSKQRGDGEIASFNDTLSFTVPPAGGAITAIGFLEGGVVVWRETATYLFSGGGFDNTGNGVNFQLSRIVSTVLGCVSQEAQAYFDGGFLVKTDRGWYVLDKSLNHSYVGEGAFKYDDETVTATTVATTRHQIRALTNGRMLVFDTYAKAWAEFSITDGLDMLLWNGQPAYLTATGVRSELTTWDGYAGTDASLTEVDVEFGWIKFGGMQGRAIVDFIQLLGELRSTCQIRKRLAKDYEFDATSGSGWAYHTDVTWTPTTQVGTKFDVRQSPRWKRCEALKARFTITATGGGNLLGPCVRMTSAAIQYAQEPNVYSALAASQKQ